MSVSIDGAVVEAQALGSSEHPALLLIAAATWSRDWWPEELCAQLASTGLHVIRYDTRDTGGSTGYPPGEPGYSALDLTDDAIAVLDAFGISRAVVMGISMGGGTAQQLAVSYPDRVAGLVLVSTSPAGHVDRDLPNPTDAILATFNARVPEPDWSDRDDVTEWVVNSERPYAGPGNFDEPALRQLVRQVWDRTPSMAGAVTNHFMVAEDAGSIDLVALRGIPALIVHGTHDPLFPLAHGEAIATALGAQILILDNVGHQTPPPDTWPAFIERVTKLAHEAVAR